jgi:hypothetical protein
MAEQLPSLPENERKERARQRRERRWRARKARRKRIRRLSANPPSHLIFVIPFLDWCEARGISESTGRRLIRAGKVKVTHLSARRIGVRSDHDAEYLAQCEGEVTSV